MKRGNASPNDPWSVPRREFAVRQRWRVPSTKEALNETVTKILLLADRCGCATEFRADIEISLREAMANAVIHGNRYSDDKDIFVRCYGVPGAALLVLVRDEGRGFNPAGVPDPRDPDRMHLNHGRGLLLMRELMDHVEYRKEGREVVLFKNCGVQGAN